MRLREGALRLRLDLAGPEAADIVEWASREGIVIVAEGEEADLVAVLAAPLRRPARDADSPRLSGRELEILEYLVDGWSNAEIASALKIGVRTVRFHLEGLYAKLGTNRRGEAVREGLRLGLVRFES